MASLFRRRLIISVASIALAALAVVAIKHYLSNRAIMLECKHWDPYSCLQLAEKNGSININNEYTQKYFKYSEYHCYKNHEIYCTDAAHVYENVNEYEKALKLFLYACELGNGSSCFEAGMLMEKSPDPAINNHKKALELFSKHKKGYSHQQAYSVAELYANSTDSQSIEISKTMYSVACEHNYLDSCKKLMSYKN